MEIKMSRKTFLKSLVYMGISLFAVFSGFKKYEGFYTGKMKGFKIGTPEASATCGTSFNCAGGGGECGTSFNCAGGGGVCGTSFNCAGGQGDSSSGRSGGRGACGTSFNCAGGGGECGTSFNCAGGGGECGTSFNCAGN